MEKLTLKHKLSISKGVQKYYNRVGSTGTVCNGYRAKQVRCKRDYEHRRIVEDYIGRQLLDSEIVHHKNGNKVDNRVENLELMTRQEHAKTHALQNKLGQDRKGVTPSNKTGKDVIDEIKRLRGGDMSILDISKMIGISYPTVWKYCKENNLNNIGLNRWTKHKKRV